MEISPQLWIVFNFSMSHCVWFCLKQPVLLVAFLRKFTCLCEGCIGLSNWMVFEIDSFNLWFVLNIINLKIYLVLWYENCTLLNLRNKILTMKYSLSIYMKVYQINRDDLVPMFYTHATFNGQTMSFISNHFPILFVSHAKFGSLVVLLDVKEHCFYKDSLLSREYFSRRSE